MIAYNSNTGCRKGLHMILLLYDIIPSFAAYNYTVHISHNCCTIVAQADLKCKLIHSYYYKQEVL